MTPRLLPSISGHGAIRCARHAYSALSGDWKWRARSWNPPTGVTRLTSERTIGRLSGFFGWHTSGASEKLLSCRVLVRRKESRRVARVVCNIRPREDTDRIWKTKLPSRLRADAVRTDVVASCTATSHAGAPSRCATIMHRSRPRRSIPATDTTRPWAIMFAFRWFRRFNRNTQPREDT